MSQALSTDSNPVLRRLTGDEQISAAARLRRAQHRAQRDNLSTSLEEMQSDLLHFSSTIQCLYDHLRAVPQSDLALTLTLESTHTVFTALETAFNHLLALRHRLRAPSLSQALSPLQSSPPSTPTPPLPSLLPEPRTLLPSTTHPLRTSPATNGWQETLSSPTAETSPAEERAAHYGALSSPTRSTSSGLSPHYNARRRQPADGEGLSTQEDVRLQSQAQDDTLYSIPRPLLPPSDRSRPNLSPRFGLGWTPQTRLPPTQLDSTTPQQAPSSVVQFRRQSQPSVPTTSSTSSSSSSSSSSSTTDTNNNPNSTTSGGDGDSAGNDDLSSVNRAATRLFQRLSSLQETTRRLRERRWSSLHPDRALVEVQTLANADLDPFDPTAPARRPDVYASLLRRRVLSTAPPLNASADAGGEEENKENVEGESVFCHIP